MALPQKLKTSPTRIISSDLGNTIPTQLGNLESALCDIFGFTPNVDITASPFSLNNSGDITKALVRQIAAGPVGWRFRNSSNNKEMRICINGTNFDFDENTGSEAVPVWTNRFRIAISTGALTGSTFSTTSPGLAPASDGSSSKYLSADGTYTVPGAAVATSCRLHDTGTQSVSSTTFTALSFGTEDWDVGSMHSGILPTRITFPSAGKYFIMGSLQFDSNPTGVRIADIRVNGATILARNKKPAETGSQPTLLNVYGLLDATTSDYVELVAWQNSGSAVNCSYSSNFCPQFEAYKIGG